MNLILFGFKGCGKTHFGKLLAKKLGRPFFDTDDAIVKLKNGSSIREVHHLIGEEAFRAIETTVIESIAHLKGFVISVGGGAVLSVLNQKLLQKLGQLVYLEVCFETIKNRSFSWPYDQLKKLYTDRLPIYEAISAYKVQVDGLSQSEVLAELEAITYCEASGNGV